MVSEINAEMMLQQLYPELEHEWTVRHKGTFYRNYSPDAMNVYPDEQLVEVARDSMLNLLPNELLSPEVELGERDSNGNPYKKSKETRFEEMQERLHLLTEAFLPFDSIRFRAKLSVERHTQQMLEMKLGYILKRYFDFDLQAPHDEYVAEAAMLLPYTTKMIGNYRFVALLIHTITGYKVRTRQSAFSHTDNSKAWMPKLHYDIVIPNLSAQEYAEKQEELAPLLDFVREHFVPFDVFCDFNIKGSAATNNTYLLNYNSNVY